MSDRFRWSEAQCRRAFLCWRWPTGFECPSCGARRYYYASEHYMCATCLRGCSAKTNTLLVNTKLGYKTWFHCAWLLQRSGTTLSTTELATLLGVMKSVAARMRVRIGMALRDGSLPSCLDFNGYVSQRADAAETGRETYIVPGRVIGPARQRLDPAPTARYPFGDLGFPPPRTANSRAHYARIYAAFAAWCTERSTVPLPSTTENVLAFLAERAQSHTAGGVCNAATVIAHYHRSYGYSIDAPCLRAFLRGVRRELGGPRRDQDLAIDVAWLRAIADGKPVTPIETRDIALVVVGFCAGLLPQQLLGLDLAVRGQGARGSIRVEGDALQIELLLPATARQPARLHRRWLARGVHPCPVAAMEAWLRVAEITEGAVFRAFCGKTITRNRLTVKSAVAAIRRIQLARDVAAGACLRDGLVRSRSLSARQLRAGFIRAALTADINHEAISAHLNMSLGTIRTHARSSGQAGVVVGQRLVAGRNFGS